LKSPKGQSKVVTRGKTDNIIINKQKNMKDNNNEWSTIFIPEYDWQTHRNYTQLTLTNTQELHTA